MNEILSKQIELQDLIYARHGKTNLVVQSPNSIHDTAECIKEHMLHVQIECLELIEEIGGGKLSVIKPWSKEYYDFVHAKFESNDKIKSEAMDVFSFCLNILIVSGITPDNIAKEYDKVWQKNIARQKNGY